MPFVQYKIGRNRHLYELPEGRMCVFGREDYVDFQIADDPKVSREHCGIQKDESGQWIVIDLGSSNGTVLNDKKLLNDTVPLASGDRIRIGSQAFRFFDDIPPETANDIFNDVAAELGQGKGFKTVMMEILKNK